MHYIYGLKKLFNQTIENKNRPAKSGKQAKNQ